jgi:hypothetical protein
MGLFQFLPLLHALRTAGPDLLGLAGVCAFLWGLGHLVPGPVVWLVVGLLLLAASWRWGRGL